MRINGTITFCATSCTGVLSAKLVLTGSKVWKEGRGIVCYTAILSVVTQRSSPQRQWGGTLRDDSKNGCVADQQGGGQGYGFFFWGGGEGVLFQHSRSFFGTIPYTELLSSLAIPNIVCFPITVSCAKMWANPASWLSAQQNLQEILSFPESRTEFWSNP